MKYFAKGLGFGIIVAMIGLLIFGAINRTLTKSEELVENPANITRGGGLGQQGQDLSITDPAEAVAAHDSVSASMSLSAAGELNQTEIDTILYMVEEEKLARDVYNYLASQWGLPIFSNIARSEQLHMDSLSQLIDRYELPNPVIVEAGVFKNPELQTLYDQLVVQGSQSLEEAFRVGAAIEEIDILDLQEGLTQTDQADIQKVFESLLKGSYNHLNSFVSNMLNRTGVTYSPQYLSEEAYQTILALDDSTRGSGYGQSEGGGGKGN